MEFKSMAFLFIMIIAIPIIALSSNHEVFFWIATIIIFIASVRYALLIFLKKSLYHSSEELDIEDDFDEMMDIDVKRLGTGISIISNLLIIVYLFYSAFFLVPLLLKAIAALAILMQIYIIKKKVDKISEEFNPDKHKLQMLMSSTLNMAVIVFAVVDKVLNL